jgi:hypothetical protein
MKKREDQLIHLTYMEKVTMASLINLKGLTCNGMAAV